MDILTLPRVRKMRALLLLMILPLALLIAACSSQEKTAESTRTDNNSASGITDSPLSITEADMQNATVSTDDAEKKEVGNGAVVQFGEVIAPVLAADAVPAPETVTGFQIRSRRSDASVTVPKVATRTATTPKIADEAVTTSRNPVADASGTPVQWSSEVSKANAGVYHGLVDNRHNTTIMAEDIATGAVTTDEILSESISGIELEVVEVVSGDLPLDPRNNNNDVEMEVVDIQQQQIQRKPSVENAFRATAGSPYSTFSIDVDNASYTNVRGYLTRGQLPPPDAVRIEELVNYFDYDYGEPTDKHPFAFHSEVTDCPWNSDHRLLRLALQGRELHPEQAPPSNLVFLIDVSGSMGNANKLPLLKQGFEKLVGQLRSRDRVAIVVYAGAAGQVLESTPGSEKFKILGALGRLSSGGSTAGGAGIELAYKVARDNFIANGNNRVILATDGDFNVGVSSQDGLVKLIEEKRKDGIFLSVLGFGTGNYQDRKMESLADNGNGNYYYIDQLKEAERVLVSEMSGTLHTIAKDVKLQIKFNPEKIQAYRLIGYENRVLAARDFDDDTKDAGELGAGHRVTALYEIVPVGSPVGYDVDQSKSEDYLIDEKRPELLTANDVLLARLRYKEPTDSVSKLIEHIVPDKVVAIEKATQNTRFAAAVAQWGMLLRGSTYAGTGSYDQVLTLGSGATGKDAEGYRQEFIDLVKKSRDIALREGLAGTR